MSLSFLLAIYEIRLSINFWMLLYPIRQKLLTISRKKFQMQIISQSSYLFINIWLVNIRLPRWCSGKESACQFRRVKRCRFELWVRKILWRRKWLPTPVHSPGKFHGERSLAGYSPWGRKSQTRLSTYTPTKYYLSVSEARRMRENK